MFQENGNLWIDGKTMVRLQNIVRVTIGSDRDTNHLFYVDVKMIYDGYVKINERIHFETKREAESFFEQIYHKVIKEIRIDTRGFGEMVDEQAEKPADPALKTVTYRSQEQGW